MNNPTQKTDDDSIEPQRHAALQMAESILALQRRTEEELLASKTALEEQTRLLALSAAIGEALTKGASLQAILQGCTETIVKHLNAAFARIWILNEQENVLELQASAGMYTHINGPHGRVRVGEFKIGLIALERKPHLTNSVVDDPRISDTEWAKREGMVSFAGHPLLVDDHLVGVMALFAKIPLGQDTLTALGSIADSIALGIKRKLGEQKISSLAAIVESSDDAIISKNLDGIIQSWNSGAERIFGYTSDEIIGKPAVLLIPSDRKNEEPEILSRLKRGESVDHYETVRQRKDGKNIDVSLTVSPIMDLRGDIVGVSKILRDITERKRAEDRLRMARAQLEVKVTELARLAAVVQSSDDAIISTTLDGIITSWNPGATRQFGYSAEEMLDKPISIIFLPELRSVLPEWFLSIRRDESISFPDYAFVRKDGTTVPLSLEVFPIKNEAGVIVEAAGIGRDITEEKKHRDALARANLGLTQLTKELTTARDQAQVASELKSNFVANVSHEIRTPMNAIIGMCNLLMKTSLSDTQRRYGQHIKDAGNALLIIVKDILDLSKIEAGKLELGFLDFDPVHLVENPCDLLAGQARGKEISLVSFIEPRMPALLRGDPDRLQQVLLNLLNNAIKFSEKDEVVIRATVDVAEENDFQVLFSVDDRGIGLSEEDRQGLFQPFMQADVSISRKYGGTGLGLNICKSLVELMGGTIGVRSEKGKGSTFWCKVPLERRSEAPVITIKEDLKNVRILIVDDQESARETLHEYVISWGMLDGVASSSQEALQILRQAYLDGNPFEFVITDLARSDRNSFELAREILQDPDISTAKLIMLTGFDVPGLGSEAIEMGFRAYLTKPVRQSQLLNCITTVLHGTAPVISQSAANHAETARGENQLRKELILIADDHPMNQQVAMLYMSELGFKSHVVNNGQEALEALSQKQYDLILLDCQMPVLDGFAVTKVIRENETVTGCHIPVVAMTANAMKGDRERCIAVGMDDYLSKPIDPDALRKVIEQWLPETATSNGAVTSGDKPQDIDLLALKSKFKPQAVANLIEMFLSSSPDTLGKIEKTIEDRNSRELAATAHFLRGACSIIYATAMTELCAQLQAAAANDDWEKTSSIAESLRCRFFALKDYLSNSELEET